MRRRRLQSLVIGAVVLLSSGTALLALGLLVASSAPFDRAFTHQQGAHATASFDAAKVSGADLAATTDRPGVTAAAGPFDAVRAQLVSESAPLPTGLIVGRADAASTVDRLDLTDGRWLTGPGQIVLSRDAVEDGDKCSGSAAGSPWTWPARPACRSSASPIRSPARPTHGCGRRRPTSCTPRAPPPAGRCSTGSPPPGATRRSGPA